MGNLFGKSYTIKHQKVGDDDEEDLQPRLTMGINSARQQKQANDADDQNAENRRLKQKGTGGDGKTSSDADLVEGSTSS